MLSALPECGSLAPERFPDTREQWDDYAQEASRPRPLSADRTLRLIPDRQLDIPTCTTELGLNVLFDGLAHLTGPLLLAMDPCHRHGSAWPSFPTHQK